MQTRGSNCVTFEVCVCVVSDTLQLSTCVQTFAGSDSWQYMCSDSDNQDKFVGYGQKLCSFREQMYLIWELCVSVLAC